MIGIMRKASKQHLTKPEPGKMHAVVTSFRNTPLQSQKALLTVTEKKINSSVTYIFVFGVSSN